VSVQGWGRIDPLYAKEGFLVFYIYYILTVFPHPFLHLFLLLIFPAPATDTVTDTSGTPENPVFPQERRWKNLARALLHG